MHATARSRVASPPARAREAAAAAAVYAETKCFHVESAVVAMAGSYNSTIWLAMQDGRVEVRDVHTGQVVHVFPVAGVRQRRSKVWSMLSVYDVAHQEAQLWMGLSSGAIEVYTEAYQLRRQLSKHLSGVYCLAQYRGVVAYAGSSDFTITQWRVADGQLLRVLTGHSNYVRCLYAEGNALVSGSDDNTIRVWDTLSGTSLQQYPHLHRDSGGVSALCRVGTSMWSGDQSGAIAVWRVKDGDALLVCHQLHGRITSLRKVGARVYAGSAEGRICVFNAADCTVVNRLDDHRGSGISALTCAVEVNRYFVWSGSADNTVRCWHHDEHHPVTAEREGFLDMRWYYATQLPYLQTNEALLEQQRELTELVVLSSGSDEAVRGFLESLGEGRETAAARYWLLDGKVKQTQKRCDAMEEETRAIDAAVDRKTQTLDVLRRQLARLTEALSTARSRPPATAGVPVPGVPPAPLPAAAVPLPLSAALSGLPPPPPPPPSGPAALPRPNAFVSVLPSPLPPAPPPPLPPPPQTLPLPLVSAPAAPPALVTPPPPATVTPSLPPPPPAPPLGCVPAPPPAPVPPPTAPVPERPASPARIVTEAQVTVSRSYEPVLSSLPPPPSAAGPRPTMGMLLRMAGGGGGGGGGGGSSVPPPPVAVVPPPPIVSVPAAPAPAAGGGGGGARTLDDAPLRSTAQPRTRRLSF
ncbi:WD domain, G-beta repeat [Novymonas esmeraldas]|uniref:WD domain, G-beta repeat n=1 Tax=Novymonas esmeraldas TaxID=1808958 RepID=A0AAW0ET81_9TRYP